MKKVAVILSGCGVFDGAEIHESVLTLLALDRAHAQVVCAAPDVPQHHVINHRTQQPVPGETRNVLVESARIARGQIIPLSQLNVRDVDAVILPGGFGAAKNLSTFALAGPNFTVNPDVTRVVRAAHQAGKPVGFICIAPAIAAALFGPDHWHRRRDRAGARDFGRSARQLQCPEHRRGPPAEDRDDAGLHARQSDHRGRGRHQQTGAGGPRTRLSGARCLA
jgi:enhancing lycopene biosynthesis protein 2